MPAATLSHGNHWYHKSCCVNCVTGLFKGIIWAATMKCAKLIETIAHRSSSALWLKIVALHGQFQSVLDVRVKRDAEHSTPHHLMVWNLSREKPTEPAQTCGKGLEGLPNKWEAPMDKNVRKTFADRVSSLFRELRNPQQRRRWSGIYNCVCCSGMRTEIARCCE